MLAVASLMGLLLAGFALDGGLGDDSASQDDRDSPDGPQPGPDRFAAYDELFGEGGDAPDPDTPTGLAEDGTGWDALYGTDADLLYGGTGIDGLFESEMQGDSFAETPFDAGIAPGDTPAADAAETPAPDDLLLADFDPAEDRLVLGVAPEHEEAELSIETLQSYEYGRICEIRLGGEAVCRVPLADGAAPLSASDIALVPEADLAELSRG